MLTSNVSIRDHRHTSGNFSCSGAASFSFPQNSDSVLTCPAARANKHLHRYKLLEQGHVPMRIISIRATMDVTGSEVLLNRSPNRASCCYEAAGMVECYHWIILGVNQK